jgi:hypothetical protein
MSKITCSFCDWQFEFPFWNQRRGLSADYPNLIRIPGRTPGAV